MERRRLIQLAGAFLASGAAPDALFAQTKQMTMVVPFPPGGGGDILARTVSLPFSETLHEKVVIFNRPGAGGNIGTSQVVKARPDGTTVGYVTNGIMCVNSHLYDRQAFDPLKDLEPVAGLTSIGLVLAVSPKALPDVRSAADLVKLAISRPGEIAFASAGPGTTSHLAGILFEREAGLDLNHIPHAGGAAAVKEVLSGRVPFLIDVMPNLLPHLKAGTLRALAVTPLVGLPGNPLGAVMIIQRVLLPMLEEDFGLTLPRREVVEATLACDADIDAEGDLCVTLDRNEEGRLVATPVRKGSCRTRLFAVEAGTVSVKPGSLRAGETVTVERFFN